MRYKMSKSSQDFLQTVTYRPLLKYKKNCTIFMKMGKGCMEIIAARYLMAILASIAMAISYGLKVNLSVAMVRMVNHTAVGGPSIRIYVRENNVTALSLKESLKLKRAQELDECKEELDGNDTKTEDGQFIWPGTIQGALLSSYFWGYMVALIPGGRLAEMLSAKWVMFFSIAINVVGTLLSPVAANIHYGALLAIRVCVGIGGGVSFPAMHVMLAHWAPPTERSTMSSIVYSGTAIGTVIFTLVSGLIAARWGWEAIFYIEGVVSAGWLPFWYFLVEDAPDKHKFITDSEREMIQTSLSYSVEKKKLAVPWKAVFTSIPFYAILVAHTCSNWGWYVVLIELPLYMKSVLKFKIASNATLASIPYFCMWIFSIILSKVLDSLQVKQVITTTTARKIATLIASVIPAICFVTLGYIGCKPTLAVVLMTIIVTSIGGMFSGFLSNHIDIAPNFAGTLVALTNTIATISGIIVPIFVGRLIEADNTIVSWRIVFWATFSLYVIEIIVYTIFGTGEEQPWNKGN